MGKGRLKAFSDGVIAIAITFMVLQLALKVAQGVHLDHLRPLAPVFRGYALSFLGEHLRDAPKRESQHHGIAGGRHRTLANDRHIDGTSAYGWQPASATGGPANAERQGTKPLARYSLRVSPR